MRLLATKQLSLSLKDRLIQHGFSIVEQSFIKIKALSIPKKEIENQLIFTSQNAVKVAFSEPEIKAQLEGKNYFCVGKKTKTLLEENGQKVIKMTQNATDLAYFLTNNHKKEAFSFFCGKRRRPEIENLLKENNMRCQIHEIYDTFLTPKTIDKPFDGILFFSPSAVSSYFKVNSINTETRGFCIGKTTASALDFYTKNYSIAKEPTETQLLLSIYNYYLQHHAQK